MRLPGVIPAWEPWPWPDVKVKTGGWETLSSDGWVWPGFVSLNGEVMSHTKLPSGRPAGMQLACTKRSARVGLRPNTGLFQHGSHSKPCFPFHLHKCFYVWISVRHMSLYVCLSFLEGSSDSPPVCSHVLAGGDCGEWVSSCLNLKSALGVWVISVTVLRTQWNATGQATFGSGRRNISPHMYHSLNANTSQTALKDYLVKFVVCKQQEKPLKHRWMWVICLFQIWERVLKHVPEPRYQSVTTILLSSSKTERTCAYLYYAAVALSHK